MKYIYLSLALILTGCSSGNNEINSIKESNITVSPTNQTGVKEYVSEGQNYLNQMNPDNLEKIGHKYMTENNVSDKLETIKTKALKLSENKIGEVQKTLSGGKEALTTYGENAFKKSWEEARAKAKADREAKSF